MPNGCVEKHQVAGLDPCERGFNRLVELEGNERGFRATFRYEASRLETDRRDSCAQALLELVRTLQARGYTQLRSQLCFREGVYLGSRELWIEYPDPERPSAPPSGLIGKLAAGLRRLRWALGAMRSSR